MHRGSALVSLSVDMARLVVEADPSDPHHRQWRLAWKAHLEKEDPAYSYIVSHLELLGTKAELLAALREAVLRLEAAEAAEQEWDRVEAR